MQSLAQLNSFSTSDVSMQLESLTLTDVEGARVVMPLMAWTPVHDIGNLTGNGVQITHTFSPGNIIMSDGQILTPAQYANIPLNKPSTATTGNVWTTTSPNKFVAQSIGFNDPNDTTSQPQAAVLINMTNSAYNIAGDFCIEYWHYPRGTSANHRYPFVYTNLFGTETTPRIGLGYATGGQTGQVWQRLVLDGTAYDASNYAISPWANVWHHFAIVRLNNIVRVFIDGALVTFANSVSAIPNTTDYSHIADYIRLGGKDDATNWGYPDGGRGGKIGLLGQTRFSNVARYNTTASITVPTAAFTNPDANTVFLVQAENGNIVDKANTYATNRVLEIPTLSLRGGSPNVSLTNTALNTYVIKNIRTPEDYFAADLSLVFARDYSGVGNPDEPGTLNWSTNIRNLDVATYDFTFDVLLQLTNEAEVTNSSLGDLLYNYYGNTTAEYTNILTNFNNTTQTTQILDSENTANENYSVTITTQHHPALVVLDTTTTANIAKYFGYAGNVPGANGRLTMTGTKSDINDALNLLTFTKNEYVSDGQPSERPNSRNVVGKNWSETRNPSTGAITTVFSSPNITTGQTATPPATGINYCVISNNQDAAVGNSQALNLLIPNLGTQSVATVDASWDGCRWNSFGTSTHEFWIYIDDATKKCNIHVSGICLSIYGGKLWMAWDSAIPGVAGLADSVFLKPRRIEHNTAVSSGTWYHVAMIYNTGTFKFYVNGQDNSTVFTGGNTTTAVANAASGFLRQDNTYWLYGGYVPLANVSGTGYRLPGFSGRLAQIRWSRVVRYTANFTPPSRSFINDFYTVYLHQFNATLAQDDASFPQMSSTARVLTWNITNPIGGNMATLAQNYYPVLINPVFTLGDINFQSTESRKSRIAYAGVDSSNNPIFVYGFRADDGNIKIKINKVDNATGNVIIGPTESITVSSVGNPDLPVQCIGEFEEGGYGTADNKTSANVWIGTQLSSSGAGLWRANINQEYTTPTLSGQPVVINSLTNISLPGQSNLQEYSMGLTRTSQARIGSQAGANVMTPVSILTTSSAPANGFITLTSTICYGSTGTSVDDGTVSRASRRGASVVGFGPLTALNNLWGSGQYSAPIVSIATSATSIRRPNYEYSLGLNTSTSPVVSATLPIEIEGGEAFGRSQLIALNGATSSVFGNNNFLYGLRRRYGILDTANEYIQFQLQAGRINQNYGPAQQNSGAVTFGTYQNLLTRPGQTVFPIRLGAWAIVQGYANTRAWMLYTQDITTTGDPTFGPSSGTSQGLWYRSIDMDSSNNITWGTPVQITDPAEGAIYGQDVVAQSTSIGAYTYIYAVLAGPAQGQNVTPYIISLRIPN